MSALKDSELLEKDEKYVVEVESVERGVYKDKWTQKLLKAGVEDRGTYSSNWTFATGSRLS